MLGAPNQIFFSKNWRRLRLSPTARGKSIFASRWPLCMPGFFSNRRCITGGTLPTEERGDAKIHPLSPRMHLATAATRHEAGAGHGRPAEEATIRRRRPRGAASDLRLARFAAASAPAAARASSTAAAREPPRESATMAAPPSPGASAAPPLSPRRTGCRPAPPRPASYAGRMHSRREGMYFCIPSLLQRQNASRDA